MAKINKGIGKGLSYMDKLEGILVDIATDLASLKTAVEGHKHDETTGASDADVTLLTEEE